MAKRKYNRRYVEDVQDNGVVWMRPASKDGKDEGVGGMGLIYISEFFKFNKDDMRKLFDHETYFDYLRDGSDNLVVFPGQFDDLDGYFGRNVDFARALRREYKKVAAGADREISWLKNEGMISEDQEEEGRDSILSMMSDIEEMEEVIEIRKSGIVSWADMPKGNIRQTAERKRKMYLVRMSFGVTISCWIGLTEFLEWYNEWMEMVHSGLSEDRQKEHVKWREKEWDRTRYKTVRA